MGKASLFNSFYNALETFGKKKKKGYSVLDKFKLEGVILFISSINIIYTKKLNFTPVQNRISNYCNLLLSEYKTVSPTTIHLASDTSTSLQETKHCYSGNITTEFY